MSSGIENVRRVRYYEYALWLAVATILYNCLEGAASVYFGAQAEALTLFGFGLDSFIEVISGIGILYMTLRIRRNPESERGPAERRALLITGWSFYLFALGMLVTAGYNLMTGHKPGTSLSGLVISLISIGVMAALLAGKRKVGRTLGSQPILADANCSLVCIYMSLVLLAASLLYRLSGIGLADTLGAAGLIYFSVSEGRESIEKAGALAG
jgi:divalent metal cation (Fe/Co/Zn/Cd) transporter